MTCHEVARRIVDQLLAPGPVRDVVLSSYLAGSRSTEMFRADSDWDPTLVLRPDCTGKNLTAACAELGDRVTELRAGGQFEGEISIPKIAGMPALRRCLEWDSASFGELFWHHGVRLRGCEVRSGPLSGAARDVRQLIARASIARSLILICYYIWKRGDGSGVFRLDFSHLARIVRALRYYRDGSYCIDADMYSETLVSIAEMNPADPVIAALGAAMTGGQVVLGNSEWMRLIGILSAAAGIGDPDNLGQYPVADTFRGPSLPGRDFSGPCWFPADRPIPWTTRWRIAATPQDAAEFLRPGARCEYPAVLRDLMDLQCRWVQSPFWRATFFSYLIYNQWNKLIELLGGGRDGAPETPSALLGADISRLSYLLRNVPFRSIPPRDLDSLPVRIQGPASGVAAAWQDLCELIDARGDQLSLRECFPRSESTDPDVL
jgi:hypothetical protein